MARLPLMALATWVIAACGELPPPRPPILGSSSDATKGEDGGDDGLLVDGGGAADAGLGGDDQGGTDQGGADQGGADQGGAEDGGFEPPDLATILPQCGGIDPEQPDAALLELELKGLPFTMRGTDTFLGLPVNYTATITPQLTLKTSLAQAVVTTAATAATQPALARDKGNAEAARVSGPVATDQVSIDELIALASVAPAWQGVVCTLAGGKRVTAGAGNNTTVVTFAPALPTVVLPLADPERFAAELATPRTFTGIVATVERSANAAAPAGRRYTGEVTVRKIDPVYVAKLADGTDLAVGGDLGYELRINFGSPAITAALGLRPSTRFFIDTTNRSYKAVVVETGAVGAAPLVYIAP